jgi:hypothetical protein
VTSAATPMFVRTLPWLAVGFAAFGLLFRSLIWASWTPNPGEPASVADVIEFFVGIALLGLCALSIAAGVIAALLPRLRSARAALLPIVVGLLLPIAYYFAYQWVPIFRLWR